MTDPDPLHRLLAAGFDHGAARRALMALAGDRVPSARRLRAWRAVELAAALLAEGRSRAEVGRVLRQRYGCSRATAYRRIAAVRAVSLRAPHETTADDTAATA